MAWMQRNGQNRIPVSKALTVCLRKTDMLIASAIQYHAYQVEGICKDARGVSKTVNSASRRCREISSQRYCMSQVFR